MIFGQSKLELKVGIFVFVGLIILCTFVLLIGDVKTWTSGYKINFVFNFINGVKLGAPVRFAGVDVGEVKAINFIFSPEQKSTQVQVVGWVKNKAKIPADSQVWVNTLGLLGEKYIEIMPGKDYGNFLGNNQTLVGHEPIAMHEVADLAKGLVGSIDDTMKKINSGQGTIGKLINDDHIYTEIDAMVTDLRKNPWKLFWKTKEKK